MTRCAQWSSSEASRQYVLGQPLCSVELFAFTSKLIIKTCFRSSLEYHNPWSGVSYKHSLAGCTSLPIKPLGMLGQMLFHVIQEQALVASGNFTCKITLCLAAGLMSSALGNPFKDTISTSSVRSSRKTVVWTETARLNDMDYTECLDGNCNKATYLMHR